MIDDGMEDGLGEEEAISKIGTIDAIKTQIISDIPLHRIVKKRMRPKKTLGTVEIVLLILGSPIWLTLCICALTIVVAIFVVLLALVICFWGVFASFTTAMFASMLGSFDFFIKGFFFPGLTGIGSSLFFMGLAMIFFIVCIYFTMGIMHLTKKITIFIKKCFIKREDE